MRESTICRRRFGKFLFLRTTHFWLRLGCLDEAFSIEDAFLAGSAYAANLTVSPNPCVIPNGASECATTVSWEASDMTQGQVWVSIDGVPWGLFACGTTGNEQAPWISTGHRYEFSLYAAEDCSPETKGAL